MSAYQAPGIRRPSGQTLSLDDMEAFINGQTPEKEGAMTASTAKQQGEGASKAAHLSLVSTPESAEANAEATTSSVDEGQGSDAAATTSAQPGESDTSADGSRAVAGVSQGTPDSGKMEAEPTSGSLAPAVPTSKPLPKRSGRTPKASSPSVTHSHWASTKGVVVDSDGVPWRRFTVKTTLPLAHSIKVFAAERNLDDTAAITSILEQFFAKH